MRLLAALPLFLILSACVTVRPATHTTAFVALGQDGQAVARALTTDSSCPTLTVDGVAMTMSVRAAPGTLPVRPMSTKPETTVPSAFPLLACDAVLPAGARHADIAGQALALPKPAFQRIVVMGDTGCRLYASSKTYQNCNDEIAYPFATIARSAAAFKPDLVVHVGDYLYRDDPCPAERKGCAGSPYGFGWDGWNADFFTPGAPLLQAAPWVFGRGNHESCVRGGAGFWRLLDPRPLLAGRDCVDPAHDDQGDFGAPYVVPLGDGAQLVVIDTSASSWRGLKPGDIRYARYGEAVQALRAAAAKGGYTIGLTHHPLLAFRAEQKEGINRIDTVDNGLIDAFRTAEPGLVPAGVQMMLSGHVHVWQQTSFSSVHPSQFVSGFSGTQEDIVPLPAKLPEGASPAPGAIPSTMSSWVDGFGYMTLERLGPTRWEAKVWDRHGILKNTCQVEGRTSQCALTQVH